MAGQQAAVMRIPPSVTLNGTIRPVCSFDGGSTYVQQRAVFVGYLGISNPEIIFPITTPTESLELAIVPLVPATHCGVELVAVSSGTAAATVRAVTYQPMIAIGGSNGANFLMPTVSALSATINTLEVTLSHAIAAYGYTRTASNAVSALNHEVLIAGSGSGQIVCAVPSGLTGTVVFEGRVGTGAWEGTPFFTTGGVTIPPAQALGTFPVKGWFTESGYSEYRVRVASASAGSTTPTCLVTPGTGLVKIAPRGDEWAHSIEYTTQQTDATYKAAPAAGLSLYITDIKLSCNQSGTVFLEHGSTLVEKHYCAAQGGGFVFAGKTPYKLPAATALTVTTSGTITVTVSVRGFTAP
jgi:hypothetical protein